MKETFFWVYELYTYIYMVIYKNICAIWFSFLHLDACCCCALRHMRRIFCNDLLQSQETSMTSLSLSFYPAPPAPLIVCAHASGSPLHLLRGLHNRMWFVRRSARFNRSQGPLFLPATALHCTTFAPAAHPPFVLPYSCVLPVKVIC